MAKLKLSDNAIQLLQKRYLRRNEKGNPIEKPEDMFRRVAENVALADAKHLLEEARALQEKKGVEFFEVVKTKEFQRLLEKNREAKKKVERTKKKFYNSMASLEFLPNSPTLFNAGRKLQQLAACFVLPVEDDLDSIFKALHYAAMISKSGSGTGFNFSNLRPKNDVIQSVTGFSSGPISFMKVFDAVTEQIKLGGLRRGAHMGILRVDHPDVEDFITSKLEKKVLENFNISVAVTNKFMKSVAKSRKYSLINPRTGKKQGEEDANKILTLISEVAWKTGDPGVIFLDNINKDNPTPALGMLESTDSCGEQPLLPYESANLGSINLSLMIKNKKIDYGKLRKVIHSSVHFLDNTIDMCNYPTEETKEIVAKNRKIGLGVMGFAEMLVKLRMPYNSDKAVKTADKLMGFIRREADKASSELAKERGTFPSWRESVYNKKSRYFKGKHIGLRNATRLTLAPTGSISIIANTTFGIEPMFALTYTQQMADGSEIIRADKNFEKEMRNKKLYKEELLRHIARKGSIQKIAYIPRETRKVFAVSYDIEPEYHIKIQAAFQKHVDNAVSKTVTLPEEATIDDVKDTYLKAYQMGCKGISIYRFGSRDDQVFLLKEIHENQQNLTNWLRNLR